MAEPGGTEPSCGGQVEAAKRMGAWQEAPWVPTQGTAGQHGDRVLAPQLLHGREVEQGSSISMHGRCQQCPAGTRGCGRGSSRVCGTRKGALGQAGGCTPQTPHHSWGGDILRAPHAHPHDPQHPAWGGRSWLPEQPPHPVCHHGIATRCASYPGHVTPHHCSSIPSRATATTSTAITSRDIVQQGPCHTPKAPQSGDNTVP